MPDSLTTIGCPHCGARCPRGRTICPSCRLPLPHATLGMSARRASDDDDDDDEERPRRRRREEEDDEEDDGPRRRPARAADEAEEPRSLRDNTALNVLAPVGSSLWALSSMLLGVLGLFASIAIYLLAVMWGVRFGALLYVVPGLGALLCLAAIVLGILAFILRPKKRTYGTVTGYFRAVIGILAGLAGLVLAPLVIFFLK